MLCLVKHGEPMQLLPTLTYTNYASLEGNCWGDSWGSWKSCNFGPPDPSAWVSASMSLRFLGSVVLRSAGSVLKLFPYILVGSTKNFQSNHTEALSALSIRPPRHYGQDPTRYFFIQLDWQQVSFASSPAWPWHRTGQNCLHHPVSEHMESGYIVPEGPKDIYKY